MSARPYSAGSYSRWFLEPPGRGRGEHPDLRGGSAEIAREILGGRGGPGPGTGLDAGTHPGVPATLETAPPPPGPYPGAAGNSPGWAVRGPLAVAEGAGIAATLVPGGPAARLLRVGGRAATQFGVPRLVVERLVVAGLAAGRLLVAQLVVAHALQPRIGRGPRLHPGADVRTTARGRRARRRVHGWRSGPRQAAGRSRPAAPGHRSPGNRPRRTRAGNRDTAGRAHGNPCPDTRGSRGSRPGRRPAGRRRQTRPRGPVVGGIGIARVPVAVVVRRRLRIAGPRAAGTGTGVRAGLRATAEAGLQQVPGLRVDPPEAVRPGEVGPERSVRRPGGNVTRLTASARAVRAGTVQGVIPEGILRGCPSVAILSRRAASHIPGHSPVCRTAGQ